MTKSRILLTKDGSHTLYNSEVCETYHSGFGAIQESNHIFINNALVPAIKPYKGELRILEIGIGTGLNVLLTYQLMKKSNIMVSYVGFEPFPLSKDEVQKLNYFQILNIPKETFCLIHSEVNIEVRLSDRFVLTKHKSKIEEEELVNNYFDVVYFDAFSPNAQPELWTAELFRRVYNSMVVGGIFTTYSCKGSVKRSLKEVGFQIEKIPGPPGKREFLRGIKK